MLFSPYYYFFVNDCTWNMFKAKTLSTQTTLKQINRKMIYARVLDYLWEKIGQHVAKREAFRKKNYQPDQIENS